MPRDAVSESAAATVSARLTDLPQVHAGHFQVPDP